MTDGKRSYYWPLLVVGCLSAFWTVYLLIPPSYLRLEQYHSDPSYNVIDDIRGTPYFFNHADRFLGVSSKAEADALKRAIDADKKIMKERYLLLAFTLLWDFFLIILFVGLLIASRLYRARENISEGVLSTAASTVVMSRKARSKIANFVSLVSERADKKMMP